MVNHAQPGRGQQCWSWRHCLGMLPGWENLMGSWERESIWRGDEAAAQGLFLRFAHPALAPQRQLSHLQLALMAPQDFSIPNQITSGRISLRGRLPASSAGRRGNQPCASAGGSSSRRSYPTAHGQPGLFGGWKVPAGQGALRNCCCLCPDLPVGRRPAAGLGISSPLTQELCALPAAGMGDPGCCQVS